MAKPLGPKSLLIRQAIANNPDLGNTEIAELLNGSEERKTDKIKVKASDIAQQRQAMKKAGKAVPAPRTAKKPTGKKGGRKAAAEPQAAPPPQPAQAAGSIDLIDKTLDLAAQCGGVEQLKRLVDRLAQMQR